MQSDPDNASASSRAKPKKERKKNTEGGDQKKEPKRRSPAASKTKKSKDKDDGGNAGPYHGMPKETQMTTQPFINLAQYIPGMAEKKFDPGLVPSLSSGGPSRMPQSIPVTSQRVVPVPVSGQLPVGAQPTPSGAPQKVVAHLPPKKSLSPSRMAALAEQTPPRSGDEARHPIAVSQAQVMALLQQQQHTGPDLQKLKVEPGEKQLSAQQLQQLKSQQQLQQMKGQQREQLKQQKAQQQPTQAQQQPQVQQLSQTYQQTQQQPNWNIVQVRHARPSKPFAPGQQSVRELVASAASGARHPLPSRLTSGQLPGAPTGSDAGGLLRQQLLQKLVTTQVSEAPSHSSVFSAYKHAPNYSTSEGAPNPPAPPPNVSLASQPELAEIERRMLEAKQISAAEVRNVVGFNIKEQKPQPAHMGDRLSPAPHQVSTIRRTPSPAHIKAERVSPVPRHPSPGNRLSPSQAKDKSQPVNLSVQEGHIRRVEHPNQPLSTVPGFGHPLLVTAPAGLQKVNMPQAEDYVQGRDMMNFAQAQGEILRQTLTGVLPSQQPGTRVFDPSGIVTRIPEQNISQRHVDLDSVRRPRQAPSPSRPGHIERGGPSPHRHVSPPNITDQKTVGQPVISVASLQYSPPQRVPTPQKLPAPVATEVRHRAPSPKPQHRHKESMAGGIPRAQTSINNVSLNLPPNAGPIRQPVVNLVRLPVPLSDSRPYPTVSASAVSQAISQSNAPPLQSQVSGEYVPQISQEGQVQTTQTQVQQRVPLSQIQQKTSPFTFPAQAPTTLSQMDSHAFTRYSVKLPSTHAPPDLPGEKQVPPGQSRVKPMSQIKKKSDSPDEMPRLTPIGPLKTNDQENQDVEMVTMEMPFNRRLHNIANMPTSTIYRSTYRAHSVAIHRAKAGVITSTAKTLDILRQNLQKSINKEIDVIVQQYMEKYFKPGIENIRINNGENSVSEEHVQAVCRQILEEAKKMYCSDQVLTTSPNIPDNVSESGSTGSRRLNSRKRRPSDTDSEKSLAPRKKKGRPPLYSASGRTTPSKTVKANEPVKRQGPKWDSDRLKPETLFVMGARANKALGLGATRGRIYIKHPEVFKYSGDQDDKQWLYENQHMPATGGKAYMLMLEDVRELAQEDEYRDNPNVVINDLRGFSVPGWMLEKAKSQMKALRTDTYKPKQNRSRSTTPIELANTPQQDDSDVNKLPFSSFSSPKGPDLDKGEISPAETEMEFLSADNEMSENVSSLSPFNITGGFDDGTSPSDLDTLDEDSSHLSSAPFDLNK